MWLSERGQAWLRIKALHVDGNSLPDRLWVQSCQKVSHKKTPKGGAHKTIPLPGGPIGNYQLLGGVVIFF